MAITTIPRNRTRQIAELRERLTRCSSYTLDAGFIARPVDPAHAWDALERHSAKLTDNGNGKYAIHVHSNHWYELTAETVDETAARHDDEMFGPADAEPEWATPGM